MHLFRRVRSNTTTVDSEHGNRQPQPHNNPYSRSSSQQWSNVAFNRAIRQAGATSGRR